MSSLMPAFELQEVQHQFTSKSGPAVQVLTHASIKVLRGERIAILGPSGSGKSTLLSIIAGLQKPTSGAVLWDGKQINSINERQLAPIRAKSVALVFQQFLLIPHLTALENVSLPLELQGVQRSDARHRALLQLQELGLGDRSGHFPRMLSGGECQRVAIARAMIVEPSLLLADEPTGNLDPKSAESVFDMLLSLPAQGKVGALALVTHNEELARHCDRRFRIHHGRLEELDTKDPS